MIDPINVKYFKFAVGSDIGKETPNDISAKCIICGDSEKDSRKKRLHLYRKSNYDTDIVHCFNCEWKGNMYSFLKETNSNLFEQYKKETREANFNNLKQKKETPQPEISYNYSSKKEKKDKIKTFKLPNELIKASENNRARDYLENRLVDVDEFYYAPSDIKFQGKYLPIKDSIVIPLWYNTDKWLVYGFQARSIEGKRFHTYIPEENSGLKIWYGGKFGERGNIVLVAESVFDAMSMGFKKEGIGAVLGASENSYFKEHFHNVVYCLDNQRIDPTSKEKSKELLKKGEYVFVWPKSIQEKDFNALLKSGMPKEEIKQMIIENTFRGIKGMSKLIH